MYPVWDAPTQACMPGAMLRTSRRTAPSRFRACRSRSMRSCRAILRFPRPWRCRRRLMHGLTAPKKNMPIMCIRPKCPIRFSLAGHTGTAIRLIWHGCRRARSVSSAGRTLPPCARLVRRSNPRCGQSSTVRWKRAKPPRLQLSATRNRSRSSAFGYAGTASCTTWCVRFRVRCCMWAAAS